MAVGGLTQDSHLGFAQVFKLTSSGNWSQLGGDLVNTIPGPLGSFDLVLSGSLLAFGSPRKNRSIDKETLQAEGETRVFDLSPQGGSTALVQVGFGLPGINQDDAFGGGLTLSKDVLAIASPRLRGLTGDVRVFQRCPSCATGWNQMGSTLEGRNFKDLFGSSVALAKDGRRLAIGATQLNTGPGYVQVYDFNGTDWSQVGDTILGGQLEDSKSIGGDIALSNDGHVLAVGDHGAKESTGYVRVFKLHSSSGGAGPSWLQLGETLQGSSVGDEFGKRIDMSGNGQRLAVGVPQSENHQAAGYVRIFDFDPESSSGSKWEKI